MEQTIRDGIFPIHRQNFQQRVNILPLLDSHQHAIIIFTLVKNTHIVEIKIHDLDLRMIFPKIIPQQVYIAAPCIIE